MRKIIFSLLALGLSLSVAAEDNSLTSNSNRILLYVDDMPVTESLYRHFFADKGYSMPKDAAAQKALQTRVVNELVNTMLMAREAQVRGLDNQPETLQALEIARNEVLSKALIDNFLDDITISETQILQAYEEIQTEARRRAEYQLRHILLNDEKTARQLIDQIKNLEDFIQAAKKSSEDASAEKGGELGWVSRDSLEPEIAEALIDLAPGQVKETPIKSRFGWHLLFIDEIRAQTVPPLEEIRLRLKELITQREVVIQVETLRQAAKVRKTEQQMERLPAVE